MSVLGPHVLVIKEISGTVLGSWDGSFFVGVLVFVILSFFKEGIGNNLTMPSWVLGLGLGLTVLEGSLLVYFGLVFVGWVCLEPCIP
jgi:hypothetical protein